MKAVIKESLISKKEGLKYSAFELVRLLLFYWTIYFGLANIYTFQNAYPLWALDFMLILICVDAIGDSIIFKGIHEFSQALVSGHTWNYSLLPGTNILKIVLFRFDIPTVILGPVSGLILLFRMPNLYVHPLYLVGVIFALILGIATHMTLSTFYFLIQGYFDPKMAIIRGNPNVKLYTKPLALL